MEVILADTAGFCFGVNNAIKVLDRAIEENKGLVYTLGDIIHNKQVVDCYRKRGVVVAHDVGEIEEGRCVVIRAHGVSLQVMDELERKNMPVYDATCPYVKKIQKLVQLPLVYALMHLIQISAIYIRSGQLYANHIRLLVKSKIILI